MDWVSPVGEGPSEEIPGAFRFPGKTYDSPFSDFCLSRYLLTDSIFHEQFSNRTFHCLFMTGFLSDPIANKGIFVILDHILLGNPLVYGSVFHRFLIGFSSFPDLRQNVLNLAILFQDQRKANVSEIEQSTTMIQPRFPCP